VEKILTVRASFLPGLRVFSWYSRCSPIFFPVSESIISHAEMLLALSYFSSGTGKSTFYPPALLIHWDDLSMFKMPLNRSLASLQHFATSVQVFNSRVSATKYLFDIRAISRIDVASNTKQRSVLAAATGETEKNLFFRTIEENLL